VFEESFCNRNWTALTNENDSDHATAIALHAGLLLSTAFRLRMRPALPLLDVGQAVRLRVTRSNALVMEGLPYRTRVGSINTCFLRKFRTTSRERLRCRFLEGVGSIRVV
jgi:hypothetical protein